jgi:uncharacterized protein (TIGR01777 family)
MSLYCIHAPARGIRDDGEEQMKVTLTGASGFIGQRLIERLLADGHSLHVLGRNRPAAAPPEVGFSPWDANNGEVPEEALRNVDAIVHLAGEPVAQRWNREIKSRIRNSRVIGTHSLVQALAKREERPHTFLSASAIGYYGDRGSEILTESSPPGTGYLAEVCGEWEREARAAGNLGLRVVMFRIGIVLGKEGGALKQMLPPFRLGMGGPMASGKQWMSWIHAADLVNALVFALRNANVFGPVNATAPNPVENAQFAKALGEALNRPAVLHTPTFALRMMLGEAADVVLASQRVVPKALQDAGFSWDHPQVEEALADLL